MEPFFLEIWMIDSLTPLTPYACNTPGKKKKKYSDLYFFSTNV